MPNRWVIHRCLLALLFIFLPVAGCRRANLTAPVAPEDLSGHQGLRALAHSALDAVAFNRAFPEISNFQMNAMALSRPGRLAWSKASELTLIVTGWKTMRMFATDPDQPRPIYDLVVKAGAMRVNLPAKQVLFSGPVINDRSPFGDFYGVEPWDLVSYILIGRRLAGSHCHIVREEEITRLQPTRLDPILDGLVEVEIDNATGLPLQSYWARKKPTALTRNQDPMIVDTNDETTWTVEYRAWQFFEATQGEKQRVLMPTHLVITRRKPYARFEIKAHDSTPIFNVNTDILPESFELYIQEGTSFESLDTLGRELKKQ